MIVFIDFEASSLSDNSYPIEVGWVWEDGREEDHLIKPAPHWIDWDTRAEAIHGITRAELERCGEAHDGVAHRMLDTLSGHDLRASAPSWDGKWLSALLRAAGLPRHALRLKDSDDLFAATVETQLSGGYAAGELAAQVAAVLHASEEAAPPVHRALADARAEQQRWLRIKAALRALSS